MLLLNWAEVYLIFKHNRDVSYRLLLSFSQCCSYHEQITTCYTLGGSRFATACSSSCAVGVGLLTRSNVACCVLWSTRVDSKIQNMRGNSFNATYSGDCLHIAARAHKYTIVGTIHHLKWNAAGATNSSVSEGRESIGELESNPAKERWGRNSPSSAIFEVGGWMGMRACGCSHAEA